MKTILLKTYLQEMIIYIHIKKGIKESNTKTNPVSLAEADPAAPAPAAPRRQDIPERTAIKTMTAIRPEPARHPRATSATTAGPTPAVIAEQTF